MNAMTEVTARQIQWFAVRMKPNANGGPRTAIIDVERAKYADRAGKIGYRTVKGTGKRVFLPEHLLKRAGFEVFLPVKKVQRIKNRFTKEKHLVSVPLLADWIFVGWPVDEDRWQELMGFDVVAGVLGTGGRPIQMSDATVMRMMRQFGGDRVPSAVRRRMQARLDFGIGDCACITEGPLQGQSVRVIDIKGVTARACLNILGGDVEIELGVDLMRRQ